MSFSSLAILIRVNMAIFSSDVTQWASSTRESTVSLWRLMKRCWTRARHQRWDSLFPAVLRIRDPVPFWSPGSGMCKIPRSGSGMNILDHISESWETSFWLKYLNSLLRMRIQDPGIFLARDPEWEKFGSVIRDIHPGSSTLLSSVP